MLAKMSSKWSQTWHNEESRNIILLFSIGLFIKLCFLPYHGESFLEHYFVVFIDQSLRNFGENPWSLLPSEYFPYGSVQFLLLFTFKALGYLLFGDEALGVSALSLSLMKLPLLIFDILLYKALLHLAPNQKKKITWFYWLNPVLFYINFIIGQLDVCSMTFLTWSIISLQTARPIRSAGLYACAALCKFHVMAAFPLMLVYIWNHYFATTALKKLSLWSATFTTVFILGMLPVMQARQLGYITLASPEALRMLGLNLELSPSLSFYLGFSVVILLIGRLCFSSTIRSKGFIYGVACVLGGLLLTTHTSPGWYYWFIPYAALFYAQYYNSHKILFATHLFLYLVFFTLFPIQLGIAESSSFWKNVLFSLLQLSLLGILIELWFLAVTYNFPLERRLKPFIIGLGGDSGTGKDTLSRELCELFNLNRAVTLEGDDYHKWARHSEKWQSYTHLSPKANHLNTMATHVAALARGETIFQPHYDHSTGKFTEPRPIVPKRYLIVQGLHTLYLRQFRDSVDLRIFLDPHPELRLFWKIRRDVHERGHSLEKVMHALNSRKEDAAKFIAPQKQFADWIISYFARNANLNASSIDSESLTLGVKYTFWNDFPLARVLDVLELRCKSCAFTISIDETSIDRIDLIVTGQPSHAEIQASAEDLFPNLRQITRGRAGPTWNAGLAGLTQIVCVALVEAKLQGHDNAAD